MDRWIAKLVRKLSFLSEAGRVLSSKNEARIKNAAGELTAVLDELGNTEVAEAERTYQKRIQVLDDAVRTHYRNTSTYANLLDVFDSSLVFYTQSRSNEGWYDNERTLYQVEYTIADDDSVQFGEPVEVVARTVYEPIPQMIESSSIHGDVMPLLEKAVRNDGTTTIKVISPGWGSSGYYSAAVLERDGPTAFPVGTHMYIDHPTERERRELPERSLDRLAAVTTTAAQWNANGASGPGLYAEAKVDADFQSRLNQFADHIGVSINGYGSHEIGEAEGRKGKIVTSITKGESIDFVTRPGAGGSILSLLESRRDPTPSQEAPVSKPDPDLIERLNKLEAENQRLRERDTLREARRVVAEALSSYPNVHPMTRTRLEESLTAQAVVVDGVVDATATRTLVAEAVKVEMEYLNHVVPTGSIRGVGVVVEAATPEQTETALTDAFRRFGLSEAAAQTAAKGR